MLFELEDVWLTRGDRPVLRGLNCVFGEGISALAGPSGSGKTTVLRLLNRLAEPDRGTIRYRGEPIEDRDVLAHRREVMLVPQLPALLEGTVELNLRFAADLAGVEPDLDRLLALAGLDPDFVLRDPARLSVGEQQRVMLARALAVEPRVLLLDEPTSALDAAARDAIETTIAGLRQELGISIVLVSHDREQARRLADQVVLIEAGRAGAFGSPAEVLG